MMYVLGTSRDGPVPGTGTGLPPGADRRMAHSQRVACERCLAALARAGVSSVDGVYAATALGCLEDTERFLAEIADMRGALLSPLPFMRSTHNTMAGQVALLLGAHGPNITFSQDLSGFHWALLHASSHLDERPEDRVLAFAIDESTPLVDRIIGALTPSPPLRWEEGAEVFVLTGKASPGAIARIAGVTVAHREENDPWAPLFGEDVRPGDVTFVSWSADPGSGTPPHLPVNVQAERHGATSGVSGARPAEALAGLIGRVARGETTGPALVIDAFGDRQAAILVPPC